MVRLNKFDYSGWVGWWVDKMKLKLMQSSLAGTGTELGNLGPIGILKSIYL